MTKPKPHFTLTTPNFSRSWLHHRHHDTRRASLPSLIATVTAENIMSSDTGRARSRSCRRSMTERPVVIADRRSRLPRSDSIFEPYFDAAVPSADPDSPPTVIDNNNRPGRFKKNNRRQVDIFLLENKLSAMPGIVFRDLAARLAVIHRTTLKRRRTLVSTVHMLHY